MIKIYVQNKPLFLAEAINNEVRDYIHRPNTIFIDELNESAVKTMLQQLNQEDYYAGVFLHGNVTQGLEAFKQHFVLVQAAGGLVSIKEERILLIFRRGKWDLPKGKLDKGEDLEDCALREIEEETGLTDLKLERPLKITYHTYYEKGEHILKESHWYLVSAGNASSLTPQTEEDIEKAEWVPIAKLPQYMNNMHASIVDVIREWKPSL